MLTFDLLQVPTVSSMKGHQVGTSATSRSATTKPSKTSRTSSLLRRDPEGPLLGYDWIAGVLDNKDLAMDLPYEFFEDLRTFRQMNKEECTSSSNPYQ